jgi:two-component system, NarL family, invasion response regulator UvrY
MRILISDDHMVLRKGLIHILSDEYPGAVFIETSNAADSIKWLNNEIFDLLILDIFLQDRNGLEVLQEVKRLRPCLPVLVLSSAPEEQLAERVLKAGANGYLNKQAAGEEIINAIANILSGDKYVSDLLAERFADCFAPSERQHYDALSNREYSVLQLLLCGKSIKEIAHDLHVSPKSVSTYHLRIWNKLRVSNDIELFRYAMEHELAEMMVVPLECPCPFGKGV